MLTTFFHSQLLFQYLHQPTPLSASGVSTANMRLPLITSTLLSFTSAAALLTRENYVCPREGGVITTLLPRTMLCCGFIVTSLYTQCQELGTYMPHNPFSYVPTLVGTYVARKRANA